MLGAIVIATFTGLIFNEFQTGHLSSSGTLVDTKPTSLQQVNFSFAPDEGRYGRIYGFGALLSMLHDEQHERHRAAFNEAEIGLFYGYDWQLGDDFVFFNGAGWRYDPLIGYDGDYRVTNWKYCYFQKLKNPYLTPYWDLQGLAEPSKYVRIRLGLERSFALRDDLTLTLFSEAVWGDSRRFVSRYGEKPDRRFLGGTFISMTNGVRLDWRFYESWSLWFRVREFTTVDPQARRCEKRRSEYWRVPDATLIAIGTTYHF